ncbi:MAG: hypothetical protein IJK93_03405 [Muribaculaceae bacterium]|nr:hypothetical protein [Muribaculaceae bacterium]MBQ6079305.1 hypothetical protein [Muribaculaceae bacterium]
MKKKSFIIILVLAVAILGIGGYLIDYYRVRNVDFQFVKTFQVPNNEYDETSFTSYYYIDDDESLDYFLGKNLSDYFGYCYDSLFIDKMKGELNFKDYDYLLSPQKKIVNLSYSPSHNKNYYDGCGHQLHALGDRDVLEPVFEDGSIDSMYLYRIKKTNKFIQPGP